MGESSLYVPRAFLFKARNVVGWIKLLTGVSGPACFLLVGILYIQNNLTLVFFVPKQHGLKLNFVIRLRSDRFFLTCA